MKTFKYLLLSIFTITIMVSCGGKEKKEGESKKVKIKVNKQTKKTDDNITNIVITGDDFLKFNKTEIKVKSGQKVKLTLRHIGKMDVKVMGHNVVILKKGVDLVNFAAKAAVASDNQYIPKDSQDIIIYTDLIGGGATTTIEFDAPEVGIYEFLCSFPGHYALMRGKFIVE